MRNARDWLFLPGLERHSDVGLLLLRLATGAFLLYQCHDNVLSPERMAEFVKFMTAFNFPAPEFLAPFSIFWQVAAGIGFILGLFTRWLGLITAIQFTVAVLMVHRNDPVPGIWPAAVLVVIGLYLGLRGSGRFGLDPLLEGRVRRR
jgi:putative oxidoreductase